MGTGWTTAEFGMELHSDKMRMVGQLHRFDKFQVWILAGCMEAVLFEYLAVGVVQLIAVTVTFVDDTALGKAISLCGVCAGNETAGIVAETQRAAHIVDVSLLVHEADDRMGCVGIEFR